MKVPFLNLDRTHSKIKKEILEAFEKVYDSNWFILGENLLNFEKEYSNFNKVKYSIGVSNGLDAIFLSLKSLGIKLGDEIIIPSNTYIATALAVTYLGGTPIFVEPNDKTFNIDVNYIENSITSKTKAIIPVHLYGQACEMDKIIELANIYKLYVIEDNAQSHGACFNNKLTGSWGDVNATSFYPGKNLGALGDGGMVTTDNMDIANKIMSLRNYGSEKKYENNIIGHNMRLDEVQSAFLRIKLKYLNKWTSQRQEIANWYYEQLNDLESLTLPHIHPCATHSFHLFVIRSKKRDLLQQHLLNNNISTLIHYPIPPHMQEAYFSLGHKKGDFPIAEKLSQECLSLPLWPGMTKNEVDYVCNTIKNFK